MLWGLSLFRVFRICYFINFYKNSEGKTLRLSIVSSFCLLCIVNWQYLFKHFFFFLIWPFFSWTKEFSPSQSNRAWKLQHQQGRQALLSQPLWERENAIKAPTRERELNKTCVFTQEPFLPCKLQGLKSCWWDASI